MNRTATFLRGIVIESDHGPGRVFAITIQGLILVSMIVFAVETMPDLSPRTRTILHGIELTLLAVFAAEYALRLWAAPNRLRFATSFFGIVDLLAILPLFLPVAGDIRMIRALRLLRLFLFFKLTRYNAALRRFHQAILIAREEIVLFFSATAILMFLAAVGIYYFENEAQPEDFSSIFDALWWAVVTLTTVGYGDCIPITVGGKLFTFLILLVGLGIVAIPTGLLASALTEARKLELPPADRGLQQ